jgi:N-acetylglucosamine kinase-like BadF-type ATPase
MIDPTAQRAPATQRLVAGIDGGQSSTTAIIMNDHGDVLGRGVAGPCDHVDEPVDSRRCADACETAVTRALDAAGLPKTAALATVVVGLSGYDGSFHGVAPRFGGAAVRFLHDAPVALAGAVDRRPAVVVIAGTGSVAYAEDGTGRNVRVGGYGYLFGDVGSSFWLARAALSTAMDDADRGTPTRLGDAALAYFDRTDLRALARAFYVREIGRPEVAAFARVVFDAARLGDTQANALVDEAAKALASLAVTAIERLETTIASIAVALTGGAFANADLYRRTGESIAARTERARIVKPLHEPAIGAARLALELD